MVALEDLMVGMKVRIVQEWVPGCVQNSKGMMDKWLGRIMTVRKLCKGSVKMEEDKTEGLSEDGWCWFPNAIDYIIEDEDDDVFASNSEFSSLISNYYREVYVHG